MNYPSKIKVILKTVCVIAILFNLSAYMKPEPEPVELLNQLIQLNIDRIAGYETATKEVKEEYLKKIFTQFANTSRVCKTELEGEVLKLLGKPVEGTKTTFKIYQLWMNTTSMLSNDNIETILNSCQYGEKITEKIYGNMIDQKHRNLGHAQMNMISAQAKLLKADHNRVSSLQNLICVNQ